MKGMAAGLADGGVTAVTFNIRGVGKSNGRAALNGFSEVDEVVSVCNWTTRNLSAHAFSSSDLQLTLPSLYLKKIAEVVKVKRYDEFVLMFRDKMKYPIVEPGHMFLQQELAEPSIKDAFDSCV